jgi:transcriptional antiterminator RfaH
MQLRTSVTARNLDERGLKMPRFLKSRRNARRVKTVATLFPGYLFVAIDKAVQRWRAIGSTIAVARIVCNGEVLQFASHCHRDPKAAREWARLRLLAFQATRCDRREGAHNRRLFFNLSGLFEKMTDRQRFTLLMDLPAAKSSCC